MSRPVAGALSKLPDSTTEQGYPWLAWLVQLAYLDESRTVKAFRITALCVPDTDAILLGRDLTA